MSGYKKDNIFAQIISGTLPASKVYEDENVIAINDKYPVAPVHVLVIPKGEYVDFGDFTERANDSELTSYFKAINAVIKKLGLETADYRIITNKGTMAGQTIFHFHSHIISGKELGGLIGK